jgi:hypothetical protein
MRYCSIVDIHNIPHDIRKHLQAGQWVYAGDRKAKGVWCGEKKNGIQVVCWYQDGQRFQERKNTLMAYAKSK